MYATQTSCILSLVKKLAWCLNLVGMPLGRLFSLDNKSYSIEGHPFIKIFVKRLLIPIVLQLPGGARRSCFLELC